MSRFDQEIIRENTNSTKWDKRELVFGTKDVQPLWVADMDFQSPPEVLDALIERARHGVFGYAFSSERILDSIVRWNKQRHDFEINKDDIVLSTNVLSSIKALLLMLSKPNDAIIMFQPIYTPFFKISEALGRVPIFSDLVTNNNRYEMDFTDFEEKIKQHQPSVFILCNPHNPGGRVWTADELETLIAICQKYNVSIISDDIHKDLVFEGYTYTPIAKVAGTYADHIYTLSAPTKIFNLAGIQISYALLPTATAKEQFAQKLDEVGGSHVNVFGLTAMQAAYENGAYWVDELNAYLKENYEIVRDGLANTKFTTYVNEGTYLLWINFEKFHKTTEEMRDILISHKLGMQMGLQFGEPGNVFFRFNIGTTKATIQKVVSILQSIDQEY
ncbi:MULTISPECIES: MalY/PatB family protein [unclassified Breznakia]|uniref:MalY/PatB family protein n=1 Tax=unclassified Breznakia TaxID=2623764 RepID=UPI002475D8A8|nr:MULTISPECIES: MalY/PatB family protein [unclassified Breznakia]MDH6366821.1 cystathionine beta-lyase [Breznakia sp. PH1-1]MDH6403999.1 cystathionine beta-lyase [Breznakia sp. PF1-11]MDH6411779.1 cystathionine beta-lyase [Breznakia sp. PFB1-11]MDH6413987.1 cystathionine beta-lyase [Breznakia sp. PFB1-14]MDH6416417.1 cystathionine beta-lyase [Breznakia sp. PFB1-4]